MKNGLKLIFSVCLAIGLLIAFTGCASAPAILGQTLEETLGTSLGVLGEMLGKTPSEVERLTGKSLVHNVGYFAESYPKTGLTTAFYVDTNNRVNRLIIGFSGQNSLDTLVRQTNAILGNSVITDMSQGRSHVWFFNIGGNNMTTITVPVAPTRTGFVGWMMGS